jgi:hypothetical protein
MAIKPRRSINVCECLPRARHVARPPQPATCLIAGKPAREARCGAPGAQRRSVGAAAGGCRLGPHRSSSAPETQRLLVAYRCAQSSTESDRETQATKGRPRASRLNGAQLGDEGYANAAKFHS